MPEISSVRYVRTQSSAMMFVPRAVAKKAAKSNVTRPAVDKIREGDPLCPKRSPVTPSPATASGKGKEKANSRSVAHSDDEYAFLLRMTLSNFSLWDNQPLAELLTSTMDADGYVPLSGIVSLSPYFQALELQPAQSDLSRAVRAHLPEFEIRMRIEEPSRNNGWSSYHVDQQGDGGGFELRPKGTSWGAKCQTAYSMEEQDWRSRTLYIENIPRTLHTLYSIYKFMSSILPPPKTSGPSRPPTLDQFRHHFERQIESITFPPRCNAPDGEIPRSKGFAFIVFSSPSPMENFHQAWRWDTSSKTKVGSPMPLVDSQDAYPKALSHGFRSLPKAQWDTLRDEYLKYQSGIIAGAAHAESSEIISPTISSSRKEAPTPSTPGVSEQSAAASSWFPVGCLVLVKHLNPSTNRTTLKKLLGKAFQADVANGEERVNYVDFQKGLDTCYVRLNTSTDADALCDYFTERTVAQSSPLDDSGEALTDGSKLQAIKVEKVGGRKEEVYWEKIPEKIRNQALERAALPNGRTDTSGRDEGNKRRRVR
ncbi:hypothetical protein SISSUDRAFT_841875 [Sistotremastrum suecicum HHB10207 ss-3]|uniref:XRRM domain-containing protein n=1 Tax=Sistotremastrum suecicum HHB10207 ss-3 TaxID=1314776 RepID=A0A166CJH1_9AGAM|nr:hypothetical protein SISSUDRAFT_841875 [Sistotremastrum suecicum HHB10207 ss-3]